MGNERLQVFPPWEMVFKNMPDNVARIATRSVKWDKKYQERHDISTCEAKDLSTKEIETLSRLCKRTYRALNLSGYARMDLRYSNDGAAYLIEANANPNIEYGEDFAESAEHAGIPYPDLIQRILNLGLRYKAPWQL